MRIGMFLDMEAEIGGGFQQSLSAIEALGRGGLGHEITVFAASDKAQRALGEHGIASLRYRTSHLASAIDRLSSSAHAEPALRRLRRLGLKRLGRQLDALLDDHRIDLVVLNASFDLAWRLGEHSFILTVWDLCHRAHVEFPEVYAKRQFERREAALQATLPRAVAVIANFRSDAERLVSLYHVEPRRVVVLPSLPSLAARRHAAGNRVITADEARRKYGLARPYVLYPAQFWPHKNHLYLLEGLSELEKSHGIALDAALCGSDRGNRAVVERQADALGLGARVHFLGFVPDPDLPALYEGAEALAMPSYFGQDVLPLLEAALLGCPVVCSDLAEFREHLWDGALYCDLAAPASLAAHLRRLQRDAELRSGLTARARQAGAAITTIDYPGILGGVIEAYARRRHTWAWPDGD